MPPRKPPQRYRPVTLATAAGIFSLVLPTISIVRIYLVTGSIIVLGYTCAVSSVSFLLYGYDKMQARNEMWRVKETTLHTFELLGGWPGALAGMHFFQHKTRKTAYQVPFWVIIAGWQFLWYAAWRGDWVGLQKTLL